MGYSFRNVILTLSMLLAQIDLHVLSAATENAKFWINTKEMLVTFSQKVMHPGNRKGQNLKVTGVIFFLIIIRVF